MSFGASFLNTGNRFLITDITRTLYYIGKAAFVTSSGGTNPALYRYRINSTRRPVPFTYTSSGYAAVHNVFQSSTNVWDIVLIAAGAAGLTIYCFNTVTSAPSGYGMIVNDASGGSTFDSRQRPIMLKGIGTLAIGNVHTSITSTPHGVSGLSKPAAFSAISGHNCLYTIVFPFVLANFYAPTVQITTTAINGGWRFLGQGGAEFYPAVVYAPLPWQIPIIDGADYD
jgi:hypothetical protein